MNNLQQHVHDLAKVYGCDVQEQPGLRPKDGKVAIHLNGFRVITVGLIVNDLVYAAALHEIGHVAHPCGDLHEQMSMETKFFHMPITLRDKCLWLDQEMNAWEWAMSQALYWSCEMEDFREQALKTYAPPKRIHHAFRMSDIPSLRALARVCWPKEMHETQGAAEAQMRSIQKRGLEKDAARIHVYQCPHCQHWHVGHRKEAA